MADYYPILARSVQGLETNTAQARRELYERARSFIVSELRQNGTAAGVIAREERALEAAVGRIEAQIPPAAPAPVQSAKTGAIKTDATKTGATKTGATKTGATKTGATKTGADEPVGELDGILESLVAMLLRMTVFVAMFAFVGVFYVRGLVLVYAHVIAGSLLLAAMIVMLGLFAFLSWAVLRKVRLECAFSSMLRHTYSVVRRSSFPAVLK